MSFQPAGLRQGAHIIVADGDPEFLDFMVRTLRSDGHCVFQAYDGLAAFELALALTRIDLLVTNTTRPGMRGPELIREVRKQLPTLPVLYIHNGDQPQWSERLPPDVPTLAKPLRAEQLIAAVRSLLLGGQPVPG